LADDAQTVGAATRRSMLGFDTESLPRHSSDVLVVGSGIAGLTAALHASRDRSVTLVTKSRLTETNTWYAQGGIAGAVGEADSVELHVADTLVVGQGLCDEAVVRAVVGEAPEALESLLGFGVRFDLAEEGGVALAREGGHSLPRVLHSGDKTGATIQRALTEALVSRARIPVLEHRFLVDLLAEDGRCVGALVMDAVTGALEARFAQAVVLATGGAGQVYRVTTNPLVATGDGIAAAWRAGAEIADMEFVQFHPTALDHESAPRFLVSEALRGEGAHLLDCDLERFMLDVHPLAELAPRDIVSREIERVMQRCGRDNVWLDARHLGETRLRARFPTIWQACSEAGYNLATDLLPVAPAAHYMVGGVKVDIDGRTSVPGLFASGEVAASGLHGANRLASNSLLEGLVFSRRIARSLPTPAEKPATPRVVATGPEGAPDTRTSAMRPDEAVSRLHAVTSAFVGMSRSADGLGRALTEIADIERDLAPSKAPAGIEACNLVTVAGLIARGALERAESRGCHWRSDFPNRNDAQWLGHIVMKHGVAPRFVPLPRGGHEPESPPAVGPGSAGSVRKE
jgi:L-aspartate oxidase